MHPTSRLIDTPAFPHFIPRDSPSLPLESARERHKGLREMLSIDQLDRSEQRVEPRWRLIKLQIRMGVTEDQGEKRGKSAAIEFQDETPVVG
jgi:hypothetical protein